MIIWNKGNWTAGDLKGSFGNQYEVIFLGVKGKWEYKGKRESDLWEIPRVGSKRVHPTEKPVELYIKIILNSTNPGDNILDPYGGSGASALAALETGRNILVYEIDPYYHDKIQERIRCYEENQDNTNQDNRL
jgi:site-specific DNA-methyltransferase (adenine-specific)